MTLANAHQIFDRMDKTGLKKLKNELIEAAIIYARIRTDWYFMEDDERRANDETRTRAHNTFIDCCNILSREMIKAGEDAKWRMMLGNDRKIIGDFACYIHCFIGLAKR